MKSCGTDLVVVLSKRLTIIVSEPWIRIFETVNLILFWRRFTVAVNLTIFVLVPHGFTCLTMLINDSNFMVEDYYA